MQLSCKLAYKINSALVHLVPINHCSHLRKEAEYDFVFTAVEETFRKERSTDLPCRTLWTILCAVVCRITGQTRTKWMFFFFFWLTQKTKVSSQSLGLIKIWRTSRLAIGKGWKASEFWRTERATCEKRWENEVLRRAYTKVGQWQGELLAGMDYGHALASLPTPTPSALGVCVCPSQLSCLKLGDRVSFVQNNLFPFSSWQQVCPFAVSLSSVTAWNFMGA